MDIGELIDFFDAPVSIGFDVLPEKALEAFYDKGLSKSLHYGDLSASEHASSFTVAKMTDSDMLGDVKASLEAAMEQGIPFKQWAQSIMPTLQEKGWWGKDIGGNQLGSAWRLETIFRTNMQSAYAVGEWQMIRDQEEVAPFLMYDAVDDFRTRPEHAALDGKVYPVDSVFWKHYHPPNGYNCRCSVIQLSGDELEELGLEVSPPQPIKYREWKNPKTGKVERVAVGCDPGFDFNPGEARYQEMQKLAGEKAQAMSADAAKASIEGIQATNRQAAELTRTTVQAMQSGAKYLAATKAAERAAQFQIDKALAEKTPHLAKAIKDIQAGGEELTATKTLQLAQEKAAKSEASSSLAAYKKQVLAGNKPSAKNQAAFDALPEEAQQAITDQLNAGLAKIKAEADAAKEIAALTENPNSIAAKTLAKMDIEGKPKVQVLEELKTSVASQKAKQVNAQGIAGYKKALLTGKTPTANQKAAFEALPQADKDKLLKDVEGELEKQLAALAKPSEPAPTQAAIPAQRNVAPTDLDPDNLVQTGAQAGSNAGGEFTDTSTGVKWYVKYPDNVEALRNEVLANRLYALAGVEVPEVRLINFKGRLALASRIVEGLKVDRTALTKGRVPGVQEHFGVDAWLSDWDVIGPDYANTKLNSLGRGVRIDPGGSLRFRAQGGMKGSAFGNEVLDLESMRNPSQNPHSASVFRHATQADIEDSVRRILNIPEEKIRAMVEEFGPLDVKERQKLLKTLLARREDLAKKYPNARPKEPQGLITERVSASEQHQIEASRANGYTIPTDSDVIEDHHVVITTLTGPDGKPKTRVTFKVRPEPGKKLQGSMGTAAEAPVIAELAPFKTQASEFLRGIGALAKKGEAIRDKDIARAGTLIAEAQKVLRAMNSATNAANRGQLAKAASDVQHLYDAVIAWTKTAKIGQPAKAFEMFDLGEIPDQVVGVTPSSKGKLPWKKTGKFSYNLSTLEKGHIRETARTNDIPQAEDVRELNLEGARVRYIAYTNGNSVTSQGYMQIDLDGTGLNVSRRAFELMDEIGLPTVRPTELDRLELYLERIASIRTLRNPQLTKDLAAIRQIKDQASRTEEMLLALNKDAGFDMRTSPYWNPQGTTQAFGHGRTLMMRPDFKPADLAEFEKDIVIYTNPNGLGGGGTWNALQQILNSGGQLSSQMDRVRRGIASRGSSVSSDHASGGANYVFTRLFKRSKMTGRSRSPGIYWKARQATRLDAFSYDGDVYGTVSRARQETSRAKDLAGMRSNASSGGNETNFRDSISVFDDVEKIILDDRSDYDAALKWFKANGYTTWPDGRSLEDVIDYQGSGR